ncbi:MAG: helix-turn-helix domain-containing protein [Candidatus Omnitrophota bacterium]
MLKTIMNVDEVAEYLGFSTKKIYRLVEANKIPASKIGRQYRFIRDAVDRWLKDQNICVSPNWSQRLDKVLNSMRARAQKTNISSKDIDAEIRKVRAEKRENS